MKINILFAPDEQIKIKINKSFFQRNRTRDFLINTNKITPAPSPFQTNNKEINKEIIKNFKEYKKKEEQEFQNYLLCMKSAEQGGIFSAIDFRNKYPDFTMWKQSKNFPEFAPNEINVAKYLIAEFTSKLYNDKKQLLFYSCGLER